MTIKEIVEALAKMSPEELKEVTEYLGRELIRLKVEKVSEAEN
jgi:hypothetical protein